MCTFQPGDMKGEINMWISEDRVWIKGMWTNCDEYIKKSSGLVDRGKLIDMKMREKG